MLEPENPNRNLRAGTVSVSHQAQFPQKKTNDPSSMGLLWKFQWANTTRGRALWASEGNNDESKQNANSKFEDRWLRKLP